MLSNILHLKRACFVSSNLQEQDILLIWRACFIKAKRTRYEVMNIWKSYRRTAGWRIYMNADHRSYRLNFCSCEKKAWKKFFRRLSSEKEICYTFISLVSSLHRIKNGLWYSFIPLVSSHHSIIGRHGSGFGRYNFGRDDFRVTWPVTCDIISRDRSPSRLNLYPGSWPG